MLLLEAARLPDRRDRITRPGMRQLDLSALFLRRIFELGAHQNTVDPIWQVMPDSVSSGPYTATGDLVFPIATANSPVRSDEDSRHAAAGRFEAAKRNFTKSA